VKLVQAELGEDMIVSLVDAQPGNYSLGVDDIVALKKAGVSDKVIAAMLNKTTSAGAKKSTTSATSAPSPAASGPATAPKKDRSKEFSEFQPVVPVIKDEQYYLDKNIENVRKVNECIDETHNIDKCVGKTINESKGSHEQQDPKEQLDESIGFFRMLVAGENKLITWYEVDQNHPDAVALARDFCSNRAGVDSRATDLKQLTQDIQDHKVVVDQDLADRFEELMPLVREATSKRTQLEGMGFSCQGDPRGERKKKRSE
jgi:hypothetical protein